MTGYRGSTFSSIIAPPSTELKEYIDCYEQAEGGISENRAPYLDLHSIFLPLGSVETSLGYHGSSVCVKSGCNAVRSHCTIIGQNNLQTVYHLFNFTKVNSTMHVRFKPGGFSKAFGIHPSETRNTLFDCEDIFGSEARVVEDMMDNAKSLKERIKIMNSFFMKKLKCIPGTRRGAAVVDVAIELIKNRRGRVRVRNLARALEVPKRSLEWKFLNYVGFSPKEYIRIIRFKEALRNLLHKTVVDWNQLLESYDYYDQSHLIHEFKAATMLSPDMFRRQHGTAFVKYSNILCFLNIHSESNRPLHPFFQEVAQASRSDQNLY